MNLFQRTAAKVFRLDIGQEEQKTQLSAFYNTTIAKWSGNFIGRSAKSLNAAQVSAKGLVYACINEYVKAESAVPIFVKLRTNQKDSQLAPIGHRAVTLLENPNPIYSQAEIRPLTMKYLKSTGNVFFYTPDFGLSFPVQMWLLEPSRMRIIYGAGEDLISGYEYQGYGGVLFFPEKYICHIRTLEPSLSLNDPTKQLIGTGIVEAALDDANIDSEGKEFLKDYYLNDARPPQVLTEPTQTFSTDAEWEIYKTNWNNKNKTNKLSGYLGGGRKIEPIPNGTLDMNFVEVNKLVRQSITEIFSISLVQIEGTYGSRATAQVIKGNFYTNGVNPDLKLIDSALTKHFRQWDSSIIIEHEYYVDTDPDEQRAQELHLLSTGQKTINDFLVAANLLPIGKAGDTRFVPSNLIPLDKAIMPAPPPQTIGFSLVGNEQKQLADDADVKKNFNFSITKQDDPKLILWKSFDKLTMTKAEKLKGEIAGVFGGMEKELLGRLNKSVENNRVAYNSGSIKSYRELIIKDLLQTTDLFDTDKWIKALEEATGETLTDLQKEAVKQSLSAVSEDYESLPSNFSEQMSTELEKSTSKITESIGTIKDELTELLKNNTDASSSELKELITSKFSTLKVSRAETIARTSANHTTNAAQSSTWGNLDIDMVWLTQRDGDVRPTHGAADGQKKQGGMFHVGGDSMPYPCGGGIAAENVNCRCSQFPVKKAGKAFVVNLGFAIQYLKVV